MLILLMKIVSISIATVAATLALLRDFKQNGQFNCWDEIYLIVIICSTFLLIIIEILEHKEKSSKEHDQRKFLSDILDGVTSIRCPLFPLRLFFTLKHTTRSEIIDNYFKDVKGYKSIRQDAGLKLVGTTMIGDVPFNFENESPLETHCTLKGAVIEEIKKRSESKETIIKLPTSITIEIFKGESKDSPEILMESGYMASFKQDSIREIRLYDDRLYQDTIVVDWNVKYKNEKVYGLKDVINSKIKISAEFFITDRKYDNIFPRFTNLHLYFGTKPTALLYFTEKNLTSNQETFRSNAFEGLAKLEGDLANESFQTLTLQFETQITDEFFRNQIKMFN